MDSIQNPNAPIGLFDSGVGGLTAARAVCRLLPNEHILYYGDTAHLPYGDKSPDMIRERIAFITHWLLDRDCKAIVIACNSAVAAGADLVREIARDRIVIDTITPAMKILSSFPNDLHLGVIGTRLTVGSKIYPRALAEHKPNARCSALATPLLELLVESGKKDTHTTRATIAEYLDDQTLNGIDALLLGCTHYPLIQDLIEAHYQGCITVLNTSNAIALELAHQLTEAGLLRPDTSKPERHVYATDLNLNFRNSAQSLFGEDTPIHLKPTT